MVSYDNETTASATELSTPTYKQTVPSISIVTSNSFYSSTESLTSIPSDSYSDTASSISIYSSELDFISDLESTIVVNLATSESRMDLSETAKKRSQNSELNATSESCVSTDGNAIAAIASISSFTTITSEFSITRLEKFLKETKLTSASEYDPPYNYNNYH